MKPNPITSTELWLAEIALFAAILMQISVGYIGPGFLLVPHYPTIVVEVALAVIIGIGAKRRHLGKAVLHGPLTFLLLALLSAANIISFVLVALSLITSSLSFTGPEVLISALAIFLTNIIVFAFWYWEIDSPGLSGHRWSKQDMDFLFTQQEPGTNYPEWRSRFIDYLYISVTNAINFASADTRPLTHKAKALMALQALISVFTLALVLARSVSILGQ